KDSLGNADSRKSPTLYRILSAYGIVLIRGFEEVAHAVPNLVGVRHRLDRGVQVHAAQVRETEPVQDDRYFGRKRADVQHRLALSNMLHGEIRRAQHVPALQDVADFLRAKQSGLPQQFAK